MGSGQRRPRASSDPHSPSAPSSARTSATTSGQRGEELVDLGVGGALVQRHPHVARRERAHRDQHVRGLERRGRARRAGRHGEAAPVERAEHGLAVDVQAGERDDVRQPAVRVAEHLDVGDGRRDRPADPVDLRAVPRGDLVAVASTARSDAAAATIAGRFGSPGTRPLSRSSAG